MKDKIIAAMRSIGKKKIPNTIDSIHRKLREADPRTDEELEKDHQEHCKAYAEVSENIARYRIRAAPGLKGQAVDEFGFSCYGLNPEPSKKVNHLDSCVSQLSNPEYKKIVFPLYVESDVPKYLWQDNPLFSMEDLKYVVEKLDPEKVVILHSVMCDGCGEDKLREYGLDKYERTL